MLILTRHVGEEIILTVGGETVRIVAYAIIAKDACKIGVIAPRHIRVDREEIWERRRQEALENKQRVL